MLLKRNKILWYDKISNELTCLFVWSGLLYGVYGVYRVYGEYGVWSVIHTFPNLYTPHTHT